MLTLLLTVKRSLVIMKTRRRVRRSRVRRRRVRRRRCDAEFVTIFFKIFVVEGPVLAAMCFNDSESYASGA